MNVEHRPSTPEASVRYDEELDFALELPPEEQAVIIPELIDEALNPNWDTIKYQYQLKTRKEPTQGIAHYFLPNIPGGDRNIPLSKIRPGFDDRATYYQSQNKNIVKVGQGEMWTFPTTTNPYFQFTISECSGLIGKSDDQLTIAHVSYSEIIEIEAALEHMIANGIDINNIHAVVSVGKYQEQRSADDHFKRATADNYAQMGIPQSNIIPFEYSQGDKFDDGRWQVNNLRRITGYNDRLFIDQFDLMNTPQQNAWGSDVKQEAIQGYQPMPSIQI